MLAKSKPSTARCNQEMYVSYLLSDPNYTSCTRLSEVMGNISHDSINRFLERERFDPKDLFDESKNKVNMTGGILSVDDTVLDKPYSDPEKAELIDVFWSGKHKSTVKGINLISLFYRDIHGVSLPINFRLVDKRQGKTKNDYFREMLEECLEWGLKPNWVTGDSWYSSLENLKFIRKQGLNFMFGVESNRTVSVERGQYIQIQKFADWSSETGATMYLKDYGMVKAYRQVYKDTYRYYVMSTAHLANLESVTTVDFERVHSAHWSIEQYHRILKQACNIERFQVRNEYPIKNHIFCSIVAFLRLEFMRVKGIIANRYAIKRDLFLKVIRNFILSDAHCSLSVNA